MNHFDWKEYLTMNPFSDNPRPIYNWQRLIAILSMACLTLCTVGCAKTVTSKETAGAEITFTVSFKAPPNLNSINYLIIYSDNTFNMNYPLTNHYFFIPGSNYDPSAVDTVSSGKNLLHFYETYFKHWRGILSLKPDNINITSGPFSSTTDSNDEHYNYNSTNLSASDYSTNDQYMSFTIPISSLGIQGNILYFSIITFKNNDTNNILDMVQDIQSIELISNRPPLAGQNDTSLFDPNDPAGKIQTWTVTVQ